MIERVNAPAEARSSTRERERMRVNASEGEPA
jgi:hypothetical protein